MTDSSTHVEESDEPPDYRHQRMISQDAHTGRSRSSASQHSLSTAVSHSDTITPVISEESSSDQLATRNDGGSSGSTPAVAIERALDNSSFAALPTQPSESARVKLSRFESKIDEAGGTQVLHDGTQHELSHRDAYESEDENQDQAEYKVVTHETARGCLVLLGCFLFSITTMGFGMSWGALQAFLSQHTFPDTDESIVSLIGGVLAATCVGTSPITGRLADRYGYKPVMTFGSAIGVIAICLVAISTKLWHLYLTVGVLFGISQACLVPLILSLPSQWFFKHRGIATGLIGGTAGIGGAINSILTRIMVAHFQSIKQPELIFAAYFALFWTIALLLVRENRVIPPRGKKRKASGTTPAKDIEKAKPSDAGQGKVEANAISEPVTVNTMTNVKSPWTLRRILRSGIYISVFTGIFISTFGYLPPFAYISTYTEDVVVPKMAHVTSLTATWPLFTMNLGLATGRMLGGQVADRILGPVQTLVVFLMIGGILQMIAWHFATNFAGVIAFSFVYGMFGGTGLSMIPLVIGQLFGIGESFATTVGLTMMATAPGQLAGNPLAGAILQATGGQWISFQLLSGALQCFGGILILWAWYKGVGLAFGRPKKPSSASD